jgi:hypothetical protein
MQRPIPRLVSCLSFTICGVLASRPALAQARIGPTIRPSAVVPLAGSRPPGPRIPGASAADPMPPLTREEYKAGLLHWARVGMVIGLATGVVFAVAQKPTNATQRAWRPIGNALVISIATAGGGAVGMGLFMITHGPPPRE